GDPSPGLFLCLPTARIRGSQTAPDGPAAPSRCDALHLGVRAVSVRLGRFQGTRPPVRYPVKLPDGPSATGSTDLGSGKGPGCRGLTGRLRGAEKLLKKSWPGGLTGSPVGDTVGT